MPRAEPIVWSMDVESGTCAVCGASGRGVVVGRRVVDDGAADLRLWRCLACDSVTITGGGGDRQPTDAQIDEYVTGGGGLDSIIANLYRVPHARVGSLLDVGCNTGFGVHYASRALGWRAVGIEPSRAGAWGADKLGIDVRPMLLDASTDLGETFDLVVASEVLEHVPDARAFVAALRAQLAPGGVLVLTTPDADMLRPADPNGSVQIVGVGEHRFLASAEGLRSLLESEGFGSVALGRTGLSHIAVASVEADRALDAGAHGPSTVELARYYRDVASGSDDEVLRFGMLTRAYVSAVAAGEWSLADAVEPEVLTVASARFGHDLADARTLAERATGGDLVAGSLIRLTHAAGMSRLARGIDAMGAVAYLRSCVEVARNRAASAGYLDSGAEMLRDHAAGHLALALMRVDPASAVGELDALELEHAESAPYWTVRLFLDAHALGVLGRAPALGDRAARALGKLPRSHPELFVDAVAVMSQLAADDGDGWSATTWAAFGLEFLPEDTDDGSRSRLLECVTRGRALPPVFRIPRTPQVSRDAEELLWEEASADTVRGRVSVVIAQYNGRRHVERALASIAAQTVDPLEVIVVDDGSTDGSAEFVASLDTPLPLVIVKRVNGGQSAARNTGIRRARGEFIAFLDQDDEWRSDHLAVLSSALRSDPECAWVFADFDGIDVNGATVTRNFIAETRTPHPRNSLGMIVGRDIMALPSASLVRRRALVESRGFDRRLVGYEDDDVFVRLFRIGWTYRHVERSTLRYRLHDAGASSTTAFLRSRLIFLDTLLRTLPDDHRRGQFISGDFIFPRFIAATLNDYSQALSLRDYANAMAVVQAVEAITERRGGLTRRARLGVRMMAHPRRMRSFLLLVERLPRILRPRLPASLRITQTSTVRAERAHLLHTSPIRH